LLWGVKCLAQGHNDRQWHLGFDTGNPLVASSLPDRFFLSDPGFELATIRLLSFLFNRKANCHPNYANANVESLFQIKPLL
jgi:hypothetical protein